MKLIVLTLVAMCCSAWDIHPNKTDQWRKLEQVLNELGHVRRDQRNSEKMLPSPPENIKDCCSELALKCFRANLNVHFTSNINIWKLHKSLTNPHTIKSMSDFCKTEHNTDSCQSCEANPKVNVTVFFNRLESLIQKAISTLSLTEDERH